LIFSDLQKLSIYPYSYVLYGGNLGGGKIWQIVFQTSFGKIKFGESVNGAVEHTSSCIIALQMMPAVLV